MAAELTPVLALALAARARACAGFGSPQGE